MTNERLPQRFQYQVIRGGDWTHGMMIPSKHEDTDRNFWWVVFANGTCGSFESDPWETLGHIIGDVDEFQWIDNDYGWAGDVMVKSTWHPINPADPTTLPGDGDANERGYIWYRFRNGAVRALTISRVLSMEKRLGDHWAPRFKQVPPVWEDAQQ